MCQTCAVMCTIMIITVCIACIIFFATHDEQWHTFLKSIGLEEKTFGDKVVDSIDRVASGINRLGQQVAREVGREENYYPYYH